MKKSLFVLLIVAAFSICFYSVSFAQTHPGETTSQFITETSFGLQARYESKYYCTHTSHQAFAWIKNDFGTISSKRAYADPSKTAHAITSFIIQPIIDMGAAFSYSG